MIRREGYSTFDHKFVGAFAELDDYQFVKLPYGGNGGKRILFVLDYMPREDLKSGCLLSGETGSLLDAIDTRARVKAGVKNFEWAATTFNAFRTIGKSPDFVKQAVEAFNLRLSNLVNRYKPDMVVLFGASLVSTVLREKWLLDTKRPGMWLGVPVQKTFTYRSKEHTCSVTATLSLDNVVSDMKGAASLLGFVVENLANAYAGRLRYSVDEKRLLATKPVLIDTLPKYKKMMSVIRDAKDVAVDTETTSLMRVVNRMLTIQFAKCQDYGYIVPFHHKDTPFNSKELRWIQNDLRAFFEGDNDNDLHLYANAQFDLSVCRQNLGVRWFENDLWDVFAGAFAYDENMKVLMTAAGTYYYSLGVQCVQNGFQGYLTAEFGKAQRTTIANVDLEGAVLKYMAWDTTVLHGIKEQQLKRAQDSKYDAYPGVVRWQLSDTLHGYSLMEHSGAPLDIEYLYRLRLPDSPIEAVIKNEEEKLLNSPAAKKANSILAKRNGVPTGGIFKKETASLLKLNKAEHKDLLFFDVLKLNPLDRKGNEIPFDAEFKSLPKGKRGKIDKPFQKKYAEVPEVAMYSALGKAKKLRDSYVKSFIRKLAENADLQKTHRIRSSYSFLKVFTYRSASEDPNLQNIPAHSELGKHIKRLFIAPPGHLYIKVDYRVHEVRGWGIISRDKGVAKLFLDAKALRDEYRLHPTPELKKRLKTEADIHVMNAAYFFRMAPEEVAKQKAVRNRVKGVIFGLIYQMSMRSMAVSINMELDDTKTLIGNFTKRFPRGMKWIEHAKEFARSNFYIQAPIGIRRHLWGYLLPQECSASDKVHAEMDRRAVNSPVQGMSAQFMAIGNREIDRQVWEHKRDGRDFSLKPVNSVHDSLESLSAYKDFLRSLDIIETGLTTRVAEVCKERYDFDFVVGLEVDFEVGPALSAVDGWDFSIYDLDVLIIDSLLFQRRELGYDMDVDACYDEVFGQMHEAPKWLRQQKKNLGYEFELHERPYLLKLAKALEDSRSNLETMLQQRVSKEEKEKHAKECKDVESAVKEAASYLSSLHKDYQKTHGKTIRGIVQLLEEVQ